MEKKLQLLKAEIEKIYAVELLEYHDRNLLSGDPKIRSEVRQDQLKYAMKLISEIEALKVSILSSIN